MKKTTKTFPKLQNRNGIYLTENHISEIYNFAKKYYDLLCGQYLRYRINHCQAYYTKEIPVCVDEENDIRFKVIFIKSYKTIVACHIPEFDVVISFGRYSMTTYQHISKYVKNYTPSYTQAYNVEYVNWF